jgi:hypothetical protein
MIRREGALAMLDDAIHVDERPHVVFGEHFDFVDFMRGSEPIRSKKRPRLTRAC